MTTPRRDRRRQGADLTTSGITDLMTSLAIIFVLLLAVFMAQAPTHAVGHSEQKDAVRSALSDHARGLGLAFENDPRDPLSLLMVIPEELLGFDFGESALSPKARQFLHEMMPVYAATLCGPLHDRIHSVVIEGHTDDQGDERLNLRLSQERAFNVMVAALDAIEAEVPWAGWCFSALTSASGRGLQDLLYTADHTPDRVRSRRVILKIRVNAGREAGA